MEERWGFAVDITYKCFHRCRHCCVKASPDGASMPWERIEDLMEQINAQRMTYGLSLTGGDIFRYVSQRKSLLDIVDLLTSLPEAKDYWRGLQLFFSPFGPGEEYSLLTPAEVLKTLSPFLGIGFGRLFTSYTLYSGDDIDARLLYTLPILFELTDQITLVVTVGRSNDIVTGRCLRQTLGKLGFLPSLPFNRLAKIAHLDPPLFFLREGQKIEISVNPTLPSGRAERWKHCYDFIGKTDCALGNPFWQGAPSKIAYITLEGNVLPCYSTFPNLSPLGNVWQEPLRQILPRWNNYQAQLRKHFRLNYLHRFGDYCTWCVRTFQFEHQEG